MRALAQGLDERASWDRYLRLEAEHSDLKTVRRTIAWIRDEFAAAAIRMNKPGTARLILLDAGRFAAAPVLPSLEEFAEANGMEDFSESEQVEAYAQAFPESARRAGQCSAGMNSRRGRVIERQLEALHWLQSLVVQDPKPGDSVDAWLNPSQARRLRRAGITSLAGLVERINSIGSRWWVDVPGVGALKALRIQEWLRANEEVLSLKIGGHADHPIRTLSQATLASVIPAATAIRPFEKFLLPEGLDGQAGRYRAPLSQSRLKAVNDHQAVQAWLASKRAGGTTAAQLSATQRAYRKEAERLLLWSVLERKTSLSSISTEDLAAYTAFLAAPPATWCGPRHHQRWSPLWRPLEGPLSPVALRQSVAILRSLFGFLMEQGYVTGNPASEIVMPVPPPQQTCSRRALSLAQWDHVNGLLERHADTVSGRRLRRAVRWLYATGLRLAEITSVKCEDLTRASGDDGAVTPQWSLAVSGRGGRRRQVPVPVELVKELGDELARHGHDRQVDTTGNKGIHVLERFDSSLKGPAPWSTSGLYQAIKTFLAEAATGLSRWDAAELQKASTHWIRHTHGVHALKGRAGEGILPIAVLQKNLGHVSPRTTALYLPPT